MLSMKEKSRIYLFAEWMNPSRNELEWGCMHVSQSKREDGGPHGAESLMC